MTVGELRSAVSCFPVRSLFFFRGRSATRLEVDLAPVQTATPPPPPPSLRRCPVCFPWGSGWILFRFTALNPVLSLWDCPFLADE